MFHNWNLLRRTFGYYKPLKIASVRFKYSEPYMNIIRNLPPVEISKLSNGLSIATQEKGGGHACIGLYVNAGSRYEQAEENGITHFFEHILLTGTKTRTKKMLNEFTQATGTKIKCFTTRELSAYFVECISADVPLVIEVLVDCVINNSLTYAEIEAQKHKVCLEMIEYDKDYGKVVFDYLHAAAFQNTPLEQTVMGSLQNVCALNSKMFCKFMYKKFTPGNMVLTAIGGVEKNKIIEVASKFLCKLTVVEQEDIEEYRYTGAEMRYRDDSQPMAHVAAAFEGPSYLDDDYNVMKLASEIVGGWDKSQLGGLGHGSYVARAASFENVCDSYKSFYIAYKDTALWGTHFVGYRLGLDDMVSMIQSEYMNFCNMITDEEVERGKHQLKTKWLSKSESVVHTSHRVGRSLLYRDCILPVYDGVCIIDGITAEDVKRVCDKYLYDKCPVLASLGPTETLTDYCRLRAESYWLRL